MSLLRHALVGLDGSPASEAALTTALHLVQPGLGRATGCYVKDAALRRAAALGTTRTIQAGRATAMPLSTRYVKRAFQEMSDYVRWRLNELAHAYNVDAEMQTATGHAAASLRNQAQRSDLIAVGSQGLSTHGGTRLGSTTNALIDEAERPLLIAPPQQYALNHLTLYYTDTPETEAALHWAVYASYALHVERIQVLIPAPDDDTYRARRAALRATRPPADTLWHPMRCTPLEASHPGTALQRAVDGLVVAPMSFLRTAIAHRDAFLHELDQPLLLAIAPPERPSTLQAPSFSVA